MLNIKSTDCLYIVGQYPKIDFVNGLLTTIREKLVKIGAKVVAHGRYVTFQMAEVAVPRDLFLGILRLIDGLRRPSPAAG